MVYMQLFHSEFHFADGHILALTNQGFVFNSLLTNARSHRAMPPFHHPLTIFIARLAGLFGEHRGLRAGQWGGSRFTFLVDAQLFAGQIGSQLGHHAVGHHLASRDGDEAFKPIARLMVEQNDATTDASSRRIVVGCHQRTHTRVSAKNAR